MYAQSEIRTHKRQGLSLPGMPIPFIWANYDKVTCTRGKFFRVGAFFSRVRVGGVEPPWTTYSFNSLSERGDTLASLGPRRVTSTVSSTGGLVRVPTIPYQRSQEDSNL